VKLVNVIIVRSYCIVKKEKEKKKAFLGLGCPIIQFFAARPGNKKLISGLNWDY